MELIKVKDDRRHTKRKMHDALGNDLIKILTELITNSDDSYRRLKRMSGELNNKVIYINVFRNNRIIEVIDNAEGMNHLDIINNFQRYGADKSGRAKGHKTRGLFGQGASDVLFTQEEGRVVSIKDGVAISGDFFWKGDDRVIKINDEDLKLSVLRKKYNIPKNGTVVSFKLNDKTKFQNKLEEKLSQFYMLRFIMSDFDRKIILRQFKNSSSRPEECRLVYRFHTEDEQEGLYNNNLKFRYEGKDILGELKILRIEEKESAEKQYGELQILVYDDENNIYDNSFFNLGNKFPGTSKLYGFLKLYRTADIIRDKLNSEIPEEILTDSRDGLNKKNDFYKALNNKIEPILEEQANKITKDTKKSLKSDDFKEHKKMFKEINKYINEELEEINNTGSDTGTNPPTDGFSFIRDRIKITLGKRYALKLLVNSNIMESGSVIKLINSNDGVINIKPTKIKVEQDLKGEQLLIYNVLIEGKDITKEDCYIEAICDSKKISKKVFISIIKEEIYYPKYGMEFHPDFMLAVADHKSKLHLYLDINKYPVGSKIRINSSNNKIKIDQKELILKKQDIIFDNIAKVAVYFNSNTIGFVSRVLANCNDYLAEAMVEIVESNKESSGRSGLINGWDLDIHPDMPWQKYFNTKTGRIIINAGNYINKYYFGDNIDKKKIEKDSVCQKYIAELISDEVAKYVVKQQILGGHIGAEFEETIDRHQEHKNKIAKKIYNFIVK